jgi:hypothetical protein
MTTGLCPTCGAQRTGERFCGKCGTDLGASAGQVQPTPSSPQPPGVMGESLMKATVRAQAQNVLGPLAYWIGMAVGAGLWLWLTYEPLAQGDSPNPLLWLGGALVAGIIIGWIASTYLIVALAPPQVKAAYGSPTNTPATGTSRITVVLLVGIGIGLALIAVMLLTR